MSKPGPGGAVKELGMEQALLLFFNCPGVPGQSSPRDGKPCANFHSFLCFQPFLFPPLPPWPGDLVTGAGHVGEQRCTGAHHSQQCLCLGPSGPF